MNVSRHETFLSVLLISLTTLLTYGVLAPHLGFYRDDWYLLWTSQARGMEGILDLFRGDRPFDGWLYAFDFWLVGLSPLRWQVYVLLIKLLSALAFFWLLRSVWGGCKLETTFITLLFVVYPGYFQQPNALTAKQLILSYAAAMLSLALTVNAIKAEKSSYKILFTALAVSLTVFYMLIYEALVGIEAVRLLLLIHVFYRQNKDWKKTLRSTFLWMIPYIPIMLAFVYWRIFMFVSTRKATNVENLAGGYTSLHGFIGLAIEFSKDLIETSLLAWGVPFYQFSNQVIYKEMGQAVAVAFFVLLLSAGYYFLVKAQDKAEDSSAQDWLILGALFILVTTFPVVAAGRNVIFGIQWDRYTYQSIAGAALFMGGVVFYVVRGNWRWLLFAFLLASGVMTQFFSANFYREFWKAEREAWWQLAWRAPQIEDGTNLVLSLPAGFGLAEEYEIWGPANMIYRPAGEAPVISGQIPFSDIWIDLMRGTQEDRLVRGTIKVSRDYGKTIILSQPSQVSCLHILDARRFEQTVNEHVDIRNLARYSTVGLINTSIGGVVPPREVFGEEPSHGWCYYYQKMDLARQMNDWQTGAKLADEAVSLELEPRDASEWMPALEAYIHVGDLKNAKRLSNLIRVDKTTYSKLCTQYRMLRGQPAEYDRDMVFETLCTR